MKRFFLLALLPFLLWSQAEACDYDIYGSGNDPQGKATSAQFKRDGVRTSSQSHNVGIYSYDPSTGVSQLVQTYYDSSATSWAFNPGYVVQSDSSFAGNGPNAQGGTILCNDGQPSRLPTMTVTASVPMRIWLSGGFFARVLDVFGGPSGANAIPVVAIVQGPQDYTCSQMEEIRLSQANSLASAHVRQARRGFDFIVAMPNGEKEHWSFMCGGPYCGPTVLQPSPRISPCSN